MQNKDYDVDMFLIYEELEAVDGKVPTARKDLCEFLQIKRQPFVKYFHVIVVHPTAQVYLARDLHNTVHGGLLQPAMEPFLRVSSSDHYSWVLPCILRHGHMLLCSSDPSPNWISRSP